MPNTGQIVWIDFAGSLGHEQQKERPVVVLNCVGQSILTVPLTTALKKGLPTHIPVGQYDLGSGLVENTAICEHIACVDRKRITQELQDSLPEATLKAVARGAKISLGLLNGFDNAQPSPARGTVVEVDWSGSLGVEPAGSSWAVVVQNNAGNHFAPTTIVLPLLANTRGGAEINVTISETGTSMVGLLDGIKVIDKSKRIVKTLGVLTAVELAAIDQAIDAFLS
jgi:mRNA interferase MazF